MNARLLVVVLLVLVISCTPREQPLAPVPAVEPVVEQPPFQLIQPKPVEVQPPVQPEPSERRAQLDELLAKLDEQYESEQDLMLSTYESSSDSLYADCEPETLMADCKQKPRDVMEMCFDKSETLMDACTDKARTLIDVTHLVRMKHISVWASSKKDLVFYASPCSSLVNLQEVYQNASNELASDTEEGIQKMKKLSSFRKNPDELNSDEQCNFNKYNCDDFSTQSEAQAVFKKCGGVGNDVHHFDQDADGIACETLPR